MAVDAVLHQTEDIFVALPGPDTLEISTVVEGSAVRAAAGRARVIWS